MSELYAALAELVIWCERQRAIMENVNLSIASRKMTIGINENDKLVDVSQFTINQNIQCIEQLDKILEDLTSESKYGCTIVSSNQ